VENEVENEVKNAVENAVENEVKNAVENEVENTVENAVENSVENEAEVKPVTQAQRFITRVVKAHRVLLLDDKPDQLSSSTRFRFYQ
jgi:hypothetical protein